MKSKLENYLMDIEVEINQLEKRLNELKHKFFRWGTESEIKLLEFIIIKKKKLLEEIKNYKRELSSFKS